MWPHGQLYRSPTWWSGYHRELGWDYRVLAESWRRIVSPVLVRSTLLIYTYVRPLYICTRKVWKLTLVNQGFNRNPFVVFVPCLAGILSALPCHWSCSVRPRSNARTPPTTVGRSCGYPTLARNSCAGPGRNLACPIVETPYRLIHIIAWRRDRIVTVLRTGMGWGCLYRWMFC